MLAFALGARFLLLLLLLLVVALWGWQWQSGLVMRTLCSLAAVLIISLVWRLFIAPERRFETGRVARLALELALFAVAAGALWQMHRPLFGLLLFAAACADRFGLIWLRRRALARQRAGR